MRAAVLFEQGKPQRDYQAGKLRIDEMIRHRYAREDANEAFRALAAGELGRGVIVF
jgi:Zn-dependent alcohol dehydrogenase